MKNLLEWNKNNRLNLGKVYFFYLFFALLLQILGISSKGGLLDTFWKIIVIMATLLVVFNYSKGKMLQSMVTPIFLYILGQLLAWLFLPEKIADKTSFFSSFANIAVIIAMLYLLLSMPYICNTFEAKDAISFYKAFLWLVVYAVIYNFIVNPQAVIGFMSNKTVYSDMISSFFDNKQTFGMFLFMAVMCAILLYILESKKRYLWFAIFFFINLFICLSRTALLACGVFVGVSIFLMYRPNKKLFKILIGVSIIALVGALTISPLRNFIQKVVFDTDATVSARTDIWAVAFEELKGFRILIGFGEGNASAVLLNTGVARYSHNGIVQVLLTGGAIKLIFYIVILVKSFFTYNTIRKYNRALGNMFIAVMIAVFVYSMGEAIVLFDTSMPCVAATILTVGIPSCFENMYKNQK